MTKSIYYLCFFYSFFKLLSLLGVLFNNIFISAIYYLHYKKNLE